MDFVAEVVGEQVRSIEEDLGGGYVRLAISEATRRQAKHDIRSVEDAVIELLRNARDADARHLFVATNREADRRSIVVLDDGIGIDPSKWEQIFEPRVTTKLATAHVDEWGVHGRGMALYSIRANSLTAQVVTSTPGKGSSFAVTIDTRELIERADQSTLPQVIVQNGDTILRGPHNIGRTLTEFVVAHPEITLYYGSIPEIVATIRTLGLSEWIGSWLEGSTDAEKLRVQAGKLGLTISKRTAYRILSQQIAPLNALSFIAKDAEATKKQVASKASPDLEKDLRGLKIAPADLDAFRLSLEQAFDDLGEKYYLDLIQQVRIEQNPTTIQATFHFEKT